LGASPPAQRSSPAAWNAFWSGGVDSASTISNGGQQIVSGGAAYNDTVSSGGAQDDYGVTSGTTILKGGSETVLRGGSEDYARVCGAECISSGGMAYGDTIRSGGDVYVSSAGAESASVIGSGGAAFVSSGGFVSGGLTLFGGGTANISGSVASGQDVLFYGAGDLALSNLTNFHPVVNGYSTGDAFDLGGFTYSSAATFSYTEAASLLSGTLGVHDGGLTANLTLLGNYFTGDFALSNDGHGGSFVKYV
jgi:autotransporter passenger strand-loop-strand repeat protein